ncbi:MAG: proline--tRNA ligase [Thermodesulfobacteriota bacterium]|nr:proline--tRNA ligase [Thermodesulfobacteriota bacterium]
MRFSRFFLPTLKETPAEAEVISHKLMLRAGMIRKLAAGIYSYLPLGLRVLRKVEAIVREEMNKAGAQEVVLPMVQPAELWQESGRWEFYGKELLRFKDRHARDCCLGPTHEEVITDLVRREVRSYRDMPLNLYQIQTKFRDEIRPRFGLMRGREFVMKDGYSFDVDEKASGKTYLAMYAAYQNVFRRLGLQFRAVEADTGSIGGSFSHEFMVLAETGEDTIVSCTGCDYAANIEKAEVVWSEKGQIKSNTPSRPMEKVATPGRRTVEEVTTFMGIPPQQLVKTLIFLVDGQPVAVLVRGDHEVNEIKLKNLLQAREIALADEALIRRITGAPVGYSGPVGLPVKIVADQAIQGMYDCVAGANEEGHHLVHVDAGRDIHADLYGDIRSVTAGDRCPRCKQPIRLSRGIEVGHIFRLGTKYSEALKATYLDGEGQERYMVMGCYGIGVSRIVAAAIEQGHDESGIIFPVAIAPFDVLLLPVNVNDTVIREAAEDIYHEFLSRGVHVLLDDRDERAGIKFKDADLTGIPFRITIGTKFTKEGLLEIKVRGTGETLFVTREQLVQTLLNMHSERIPRCLQQG